MQGIGDSKPAYGTPIQWGHPLAAGLWVCLLFNEGQRDPTIDQKIQNLCAPSSPATIPTSSVSHSPNGWLAWTTGPGGAALTNLTNSGGTRLQIPAPPATISGEGVSFETCINPISFTDNYGEIFGVNGSAGFYLRSTGKIDLYVAGDNIISNTALSLNTWTHLVVVIKNGITTTYLNGRVDFQGATSSLVGWVPDVAFNDSGSETFDGSMTHIRAWKRALSPADAWSLYTDRYAMFRPPVSRFIAMGGGTVAPADGTASITLDAATVSGVADVAVSGSASMTLGPVTLTGVSAAVKPTIRYVIPRTLATVGYINTTQYCGVADGYGYINDSGRGHPCAVDTTFRNLTLYCASPLVRLVEITFMLDDVDELLTVKWETGDPVQVSDIINSVFVPAGHVIGYKIHTCSVDDDPPTCSSVTPPGADIGVSIDAEGTEQIFGVCSFGGSVSNGTAFYGGAFGNGYFSLFGGGPTFATSRSICAIEGAATTLAVHSFTGPPGAGIWTAMLRKNRVLQDGTGGTVDTQVVLTGSDEDKSRAFVLPCDPQVDVVDAVVTRTGEDAAFAVEHIGVGVGFTPVDPLTFMFCGGSNDTIPNPGPTWKWTRSYQNAPLEYQHTAPVGRTGFTVSGMYVERPTAPGGSEVDTQTLLRNGQSTGVVVEITGTQTTGQTSGPLERYGPGELITLQSEQTGGALSSEMLWSIALRMTGAPEIGPYAWVHWPRRIP